MPFPIGIVKPKNTKTIKKNCVNCGAEFILHIRRNGKILRRRPWILDNDHCTVKCMKKHLEEENNG